MSSIKTKEKAIKQWLDGIRSCEWTDEEKDKVTDLVIDNVNIMTKTSELISLLSDNNITLYPCVEHHIKQLKNCLFRAHFYWVALPIYYKQAYTDLPEIHRENIFI